MDLRRIEHLLQVADYGSFSRAASVIGIAQPALGRQIKKLEEEYGAPLLYRNGRGVTLTPDGEKLLTRLRPLMRQLESAVLELRDDRQSPSGSVTIGLTPTLCGMLGIRLIAAVRERFPRVQLNVISGYSGYVHEWLANARLDIAVLHDARRSRHLIVDPLAELALSLISPVQTVVSGRRRQTIDFAELKGLPLVLPTRNHGLRRTVEYAASQAGIPLSVIFEIDALELMREIMTAGLAHTVLAAPAVRSELESGSVIARLLKGPRLSTRLLLVTASNRPVTRAVKAVEGELRALLRQMALEPPFTSSLTVAGAGR